MAERKGIGERRQRRVLAVLVGTILGALVGCSSEADSANPEVDGATSLVEGCESPDQLVVTNSIGDGIPELMVVNGTEQRTLQPGWLLSQPSLSPDGAQVVAVRATIGDYESAGPDEEQLWVLEVDGSDAYALTDGLRARWPDWSPDGRTVVYVEETRDGAKYLSVVAADGGGESTRLFPIGDDSATTPTWSPGGKQIAVNLDGDLVVVDADGTDTTTVASVPAYSKVGWSPDGKSLVVTSFEQSEQTGGPKVLTRYDLDTGDAQRLGVGDNPKWVGDGKRLYFIDNGGLGTIRGGPAPEGPFDPNAFAIVYEPDPDRVWMGLGAGFDASGC